MTATFFLVNTETDAIVDGAEELEINVSNHNARHLLGTLGFDTEELCGEATAEVFLGAVMIAQGLNPADEGVPAHELTPAEVAADPVLGMLVGGSGATVIHGGRHPGYTDERLVQLRDLAEFALVHNATVVWS